MSEATANTLVELIEATEDGAPQTGRFGPLVGSCPELRELFGMLRHVAPTTLTLLVQGDGAGSADVARAVHSAGPRSDGPFEAVVLNTLPAHRVEATLFGSTEGGLKQAGAFERAQLGTLFIDEVGDLHPSLQPRLLTVLERRELTPPGAAGAIPVDVRVITATRRDLWLDVEAGRFREDLYFHLAQVRVTVPTLGECAGELVRSTPSSDLGAPFAVAKQKVVDRFEKQYLGQLMQQTGGNISRAAREAELARHHLRDLLKKHGLYEGAESASTFPPRSK